MFDQINTMFQFSKNALNIIAYRQKIFASNIANIDTPNYQRLNINFKNQLNTIMRYNNNQQLNLLNTSNKHLYPVIENIPIDNTMNNHKLFNNKNNIDINKERMNFIKNSLKYQIQMTFLNNEIKNIMTVIKG
ncbi:MAG TPA: flagellar basal body rod protein FlgB [Buchnera sp. (in: enterobacteria)]|nr:flagellar basal body rod protein FlgB [Buchnera sp. (in: enterobacteria)]